MVTAPTQGINLVWTVRGVACVDGLTRGEALVRGLEILGLDDSLWLVPPQ